MLNLPSYKGGFEIMNRIMAVRCVEGGGFHLQYFSGGILDRVKRCVVTVDRGRNCVDGPSIAGVL